MQLFILASAFFDPINQLSTMSQQFLFTIISRYVFIHSGFDVLWSWLGKDQRKKVEARMEDDLDNNERRSIPKWMKIEARVKQDRGRDGRWSKPEWKKIETRMKGHRGQIVKNESEERKLRPNVSEWWENRGGGENEKKRNNHK